MVAKNKEIITGLGFDKEYLNESDFRKHLFKKNQNAAIAIVSLLEEPNKDSLINNEHQIKEP